MPSPKIPVVVDKPRHSQPKSKFGYKNQAHEFEDADWAWVLKRKFPRVSEPGYHRSSLALPDIHVYAWDKDRQPINPALTQYFTPDKEGKKGAEKYARFLIEEGHAILATVVCSVMQTWDGFSFSVESQDFQRPDINAYVDPEN